MSKLHPMHKVVFSFSELWRAPLIPYLNVDSDFIKARNFAINSWFGEIDLRIQKIDVSCETAEYDLRKASPTFLTIAYGKREFKGVVSSF